MIWRSIKLYSHMPDDYSAHFVELFQVKKNKIMAQNKETSYIKINMSLRLLQVNGGLTIKDMF